MLEVCQFADLLCQDVTGHVLVYFLAGHLCSLTGAMISKSSIGAGSLGAGSSIAVSSINVEDLSDFSDNGSW